MAEKRVALRDLQQVQAAPAEPKTPVSFKSRRQTQSAKALRSRQQGTVNPSSARGILRRLAKVTAASTQRRVRTPSTEQQSHRTTPERTDSDDVEEPISRFVIEESIEEDHSEALEMPTPSALVEESDEDLVQPTFAFDTEFLPTNSIQQDQTSLERTTSHSPDTFLTEKGRRAVSEDITRMSRYSFGSIRMSDFGSELEIRRQSDRQAKIEALELDDTREDDQMKDSETQDLQQLINANHTESTSINPEHEHDMDEAIGTGDFELPYDDEGLHLDNDLSQADLMADQLLQRPERPRLAMSSSPRDNSAPELDEVELDVREEVAEDPEAVNHSTLLENIVDAARPRTRKRQKLNSYGNMVPNLPAGLIKKIVHQSQEKAGKKKTSLGKEHMRALEQASEWYFEQVATDLAAYSNHGRKRQRINSDDILLLMKRQRTVAGEGDLAQIARDWLPRELGAELELPDRP